MALQELRAKIDAAMAFGEPLITAPLNDEELTRYIISQGHEIVSNNKKECIVRLVYASVDECVRQFCCVAHDKIEQVVIDHIETISTLQTPTGDIYLQLPNKIRKLINVDVAPDTDNPLVHDALFIYNATMNPCIALLLSIIDTVSPHALMLGIHAMMINHPIAARELTAHDRIKKHGVVSTLMLLITTGQPIDSIVGTYSSEYTLDNKYCSFALYYNRPALYRALIEDGAVDSSYPLNLAAAHCHDDLFIGSLMELHPADIPNAFISACVDAPNNIALFQDIALPDDIILGGLHKAIDSGRVSSLVEILMKHYRRNGKKPHNNTIINDALVHAVGCNNYTIVQILLESGADASAAVVFLKTSHRYYVGANVRGLIRAWCAAAKK